MVQWTYEWAHFIGIFIIFMGIHGLTSFLPSPQAGATQPKKLTKVGSSESKIGRLPLK